jgi:hypothetical protein
MWNEVFSSIQPLVDGISVQHFGDGLSEHNQGLTGRDIYHHTVSMPKVCS